MYPEIKTIPRGKKLQPLREKIATLKGNKKNMKKLIFFTILFTIITITGWAKTKNIVWDAPTTEYGTSYGDGYFYLALDVTKVELKSDETVEERWKQLFPSYWRDEQGDWKIAAGQPAMMTKDDNDIINNNVNLNDIVNEKRDPIESLFL